MDEKIELIDAIIDSSMFKMSLNPDLINSRNISDNSFGVFVTVNRDNKRLSESDKVHGCIGDWNKTFEKMEKSELIKMTNRVSFSATHEDSRKNKFSESLYEDVLAEYEITFMTLPIMKIDENGYITNTSEPFDNNNYGLLVQGSQVSKATFLPKVFKSSSWSNIRSHINEKANIEPETASNTSLVQYYAYKGDVIRRCIFDHLVEPFVKFIKIHYKTKIPYEYRKIGATYKAIIDPKNYVRNIASIRHLLFLCKSGYDLNSIKTLVKAEIDEYIDMFKFTQDRGFLRQAVPFLLMCVVDNVLYKDTTVEMIEYLLSNLDKIKKTDNVFEYGEALTGLAFCVNFIGDDKLRDRVKSSLKSELVSICNDLQSDRSAKDSNKKVDVDVDVKTDVKIFQLNWNAQALTESFKSKIDFEKYGECATILVDSVLNISKDFNEKTESNLLCVSFEALTGLSILYQSNDLSKEITRLMILIRNRTNSNGLVEFLTGDSRIDITGHFLNGLMHLRYAHNLRQNQSGGSNKANGFDELNESNKSKNLIDAKFIYKENKNMYIKIHVH